MFYIDTSVAVALLTQEQHSIRAKNTIDALLRQGVKGACSDWTRAEFRCAIASKLRARLITENDFEAVSNGLDLLSQRKFTLVPTLTSDVVRAGKIASSTPKIPLRAADSLHLAIAARIGVTHFVSFDANQVLCAKAVLVGVQFA